MVDNTFASPYLQQPLALGADVVVHSTTKYLGGHSDVVGGALVLADGELAEQLRFHQNAMGAVPGPFDCWLVLRGVKTLGVRMDRHSANALRIAEMLVAHPAVAVGATTRGCRPTPGTRWRPSRCAGSAGWSRSPWSAASRRRCGSASGPRSSSSASRSAGSSR